MVRALENSHLKDLEGDGRTRVRLSVGKLVIKMEYLFLNVKVLEFQSLKNY